MLPPSAGRAAARRCWLWLLWLCLATFGPSLTEACAHPLGGVRVGEASNLGPGHAFDDPEAGIWEHPEDDDHAEECFTSVGTSLHDLGRSWQDHEQAEECFTSGSHEAVEQSQAGHDPDDLGFSTDQLRAWREAETVVGLKPTQRLQCVKGTPPSPNTQVQFAPGQPFEHCKAYAGPYDGHVFKLGCKALGDCNDHSDQVCSNVVTLIPDVLI